MKKSIMSLGLALATFGNVAAATIVNPATAVETAITITPLCTAISKGDVEAVRKFVEYGADVNQKSNGMTPLMMAARYNNVEIIKILMSKGADVKAKNDNGFTALKFAELSNAHEAVSYLTQHLAK
ncbi:MAG TPA: ankyrin repeat domain-containing protein [Flavobacterium sp.]|nr:ankyrin repeat domain-containing protein [Flavobacterium sp.]